MMRAIPIWAVLCVGLVAQDGGMDRLLQRIEQLEAQARERDLQIVELRSRLGAYESEKVAPELEVMIQDLADGLAPNVAAPGSFGISFGGSIRFRGEYRDVKDYGGGENDSVDFIIQRTRLHVDADVHQNVRVFVELEDARRWGDTGVPRASSSFGLTTPASLGPGTEDGVFVYQAFVDFRNVFGHPWTFRVGRQELVYGDQRLVSPLDWDPVGRTFDGVRTWYEGECFQLDLFAMNVDENSLVAGADADDDWLFAGIYLATVPFENHQADVYAFYRTFADGRHPSESGTTGDLEDVTFGGRFSGSTDGLSYGAEAVGQLGDRAGDDVEAFGLAARVAYSFGGSWNPTVGLDWSFGSGDDDPTDGDFETFDPLFPFGHAYQGYLDLFSWRNGHDFAAKFSVKPTPELFAEVAVHHFLLDSDNDAWYGAGLGAIRRAPAGGVGNSVGWEVDVHFKYALSASTNLWFGYSHLFTGDYVDDTGLAPDTDWAFFQSTTTF